MTIPVAIQYQRFTLIFCSYVANISAPSSCTLLKVYTNLILLLVSYVSNCVQKLILLLMGGIVQCSSLGDKTVALVLMATNQYSMHFSDAFSFRILAIQKITV